MRFIVQRVNSAKLYVDDKEISKINQGLIVFVGLREGDTDKHFDWMIKKVCGLRIFRDENDKMNLSVQDVGGEILVVSNFTLYADVSRGNRPNFMNALESTKAKLYYEEIVSKFNSIMPNKIKTGMFGEHMHIKQENDGPINIIIDSDELFKE